MLASVPPPWLEEQATRLIASAKAIVRSVTARASEVDPVERLTPLPSFAPTLLPQINIAEPEHQRLLYVTTELSEFRVTDPMGRAHEAGFAIGARAESWRSSLPLLLRMMNLGILSSSA
jgi:hypothetical protein